MNVEQKIPALVATTKDDDECHACKDECAPCKNDDCYDCKGDCEKCEEASLPKDEDKDEDEDEDDDDSKNEQSEPRIRGIYDITSLLRGGPRYSGAPPTSARRADEDDTEDDPFLKMLKMSMTVSRLNQSEAPKFAGAIRLRMLIDDKLDKKEIPFTWTIEKLTELGFNPSIVDDIANRAQEHLDQYNTQNDKFVVTMDEDKAITIKKVTVAARKASNFA